MVLIRKSLITTLLKHILNIFKDIIKHAKTFWLRTDLCLTNLSSLDLSLTMRLGDGNVDNISPAVSYFIELHILLNTSLDNSFQTKATTGKKKLKVFNLHIKNESSLNHSCIVLTETDLISWQSWLCSSGRIHSVDIGSTFCCL